MFDFFKSYHGFQHLRLRADGPTGPWAPLLAEAYCGTPPELFEAGTLQWSGASATLAPMCTRDHGARPNGALPVWPRLARKPLVWMSKRQFSAANAPPREAWLRATVLPANSELIKLAE